MPDPAVRNNAHYGPLFSRFKADVAGAPLGFEVECLGYELKQVPSVPEGGLVLDAGCGTGRYAAAWRTLFPSATVVGVDLNGGILRDGQVSPGALHPVNGNLESLPFASNTFDVVMSRGVIQHTTNPARALQELVRVCRPGGLLYFYTYRHGWYDVVLGGCRKVAARIGVPACSSVIYRACRLARLDPRVSTMILDELFVPIRFAFTPETIDAWLRAEGIPARAIHPLVHAQFGGLTLPVDRKTAILHRVLPKNQLITLAVYKPAAATVASPPPAA
jgi:SAM-dependent methyltransferase